MFKHVLIAAAYLFLAAATGLVLPQLVPGLGAVTGWTAAGAVVILGLIAHEAAARAAQSALAGDAIARLGAELAAARREINRLGDDIERLDRSVAAVADDSESKAKTRLDRVVDEVRVLQSLIERISAKAAAPTGDPAPQGRTAPRAEPPKAVVHDALDEGQILGIVRDGLKRNRVDLYLQPIVSLPQRKVRFYECFSRIRAADGGVILPEQYISVAKREGLIGTIDNVLLFRCVQLVRKAQRRRHNIGFFCNISAHTLQDHAFFAEFVRFLADNEDLARNLIFEFSQDDLDRHAVEVAEVLGPLARLGFIFSLDRVHDLGRLDVAALAAKGFKYVKVGAAALLGREGAGAVEMAAAVNASGPTIVGVDVAALKREMDRHGIDMVVDKLEGEPDLVELLDFDIDFGQGYLFGEPRVSRDG